jgi:Ca2+/Na+ antiporter
MSPRDLFSLAFLVALVELLGACIIGAHVVWALTALLRSRNIVHARLIVADGAILGLSCKVIASVLRTIMLKSWKQILFFAITLCLRTLMKKMFKWEMGHVQRRLRLTLL